MRDGALPSNLWQETQKAVAAWEPSRPAQQTGQVLILPELDEPRLAWATLRRETGNGAKRLLVAADANPLVGSGDIAVDDSGLGRLTLRCRFAVWVSERDLGGSSPLGILPPEALSRAETRWQALAAGRRVGTFSEQETEEDPEYRDWIEEVVKPAAGKLVARTGRDSSGLPPVRPFPAPPASKPPPARQRTWIGWAAVLAFVALSAGSGFLFWRQGQEIASLRTSAGASEAAHRQALAELESRREALEAQYQARLLEAGEDRTRIEAEHRSRLQELETRIAGLRQAAEVRNPLLKVLEAGDVQRGPTPVKVGPEASHLVLLLPVDDPPGTEFQIEVSDLSSDRRILVQKGLRSDLIEVRLGLPTALLPPGAYRLRLFRMDGGKPHLVREHRIEIEPEPERRRLNQ